MPKAPVFTPKAPIEKLPLAVRKASSSSYFFFHQHDHSMLMHVSWCYKISGLLGFPLKINTNVNAVWAYAQSDTATQASSTFAGYVDGFISALKNYVEHFGDLGKEYFKKAVTNAELTVTVNEAGECADSITADVKDGVFRILFHQDRLGYNQSWLNEPLIKAIDQAPQQGFGLLAKHSIEKEYNDEIDDVRQEIADILALPDVVLDANFEENYAKLLLLKKDDQDWQKNSGGACLQYFRDGFKYQINNQGFKGDDMLQEGFAEIVTSKTIKLRLVDKTQNGYSNETIVENGTVYLQATPDRWLYDVSEAGSGLLDKL
ncbi:hypothetical protein M413DRAFT_23115 [Hebeloma cylindrosporum]|uniref:Uncharacterized protein n=1 Tax=Hebeloma cylindrosporum TaxID=76867 RepID=A0A0C2Z0S5_HEBCY|nr:hypothetical protein M413DRAFT_23115 [Hebeloma cylindrosporum h7]